MRKLIVSLLILGVMLLGGTAFASPTTDFEKGKIVFEIGSTANSKVHGEGGVKADTTGKSGFKYAVTSGLGNNWAIQFKQGMFRSVDSPVPLKAGTVVTYAEAKPIDVNLLYKVNPNLTLIAGYEHDKISYGMYASDSAKSAVHFGATGTHKLSSKDTLFATLLGGHDVSLKEIGVSHALSKNTSFNLSYAERKMKNVSLQAPIIHLDDKVDYTMTGITCVFAFKL